MSALGFALALMVMAAPEAAPATGVDQDFKSANDKSLEGDFDAAVALYESVLSRTGDVADVYFNLGNAHAQAGRPVDAIISYERVLRIEPGHEDARHNLAVVRRQQLPQTEDASGDVSAASALLPVAALAPPRRFGALLAAFGCLIFVGLALSRWTARRAGGRVLAGLAFAGWLSAAVGLTAHAALDAERRIVVREQARLLEGPNSKFKKTIDLPRGTGLRVLAEDGVWLQGQTEAGVVGWVDGRRVARIEARRPRSN